VPTKMKPPVVRNAAGGFRASCDCFLERVAKCLR
jgi:hypothetical protein